MRLKLQSRHLSLRTKLIWLFVVIKVLPLLLLAVLAWEGFRLLGDVNENSVSDGLCPGVAVDEVSKSFAVTHLSYLRFACLKEHRDVDGSFYTV